MENTQANNAFPLADPLSKRSLVLAGGGMRVAYQAGVLKAMQEAGMAFFHADGTSGGTINLAMLLSGHTPDDMCRRWRSLNVRKFASLLPLRHYLKGLRVTALGDADGIVRTVFPHLGIDPARIRASSGMSGTFNVCNFTRKTNEAIPHTEIDLDLLVAGISLPIFMPPVHKGNTIYVDSVWIKDANLTEAVKRGAEELWLVWCIGNTGQYRDGPFNQYVHMIEISAAGALNIELDWLRELNVRIARGDSPYGQTCPVRLHVIKPEFPLPLDPDFYLGRIDAATLINLGYSDTMHYLKTMSPNGITLDDEATMMNEITTTGIGFRETMAGGFSLGESDPQRGHERGVAAGTQLAMHATIDIRDIKGFVADAEHVGSISGSIDFPPLGMNMPSTHGVFKLFSPSGEPGLKWMVYELGFRHAGCHYYLAGKKQVRNASVIKLWSATTTLYTQLHEGDDSSGPVVGAGILSLDMGTLMKLASNLHASNAPTFPGRVGAVSTFAKFFMKELVATYIRRH